MNKIVCFFKKILFTLCLTFTFLLNSLSAMILIGEGFDKLVYKNTSRQALVEFKDGHFKNYQKERDFLLKFEHPNIVRLLDHDDESMTLWQELGDMDLRLYIDSDFLSKLNINKQLEIKIKILIDICSGMSYLHKQGYVHRDIKPENILIFLDEYNYPTAKLIDFAFATDIFEAIKLSGTSTYLSPRLLSKIKTRQPRFSDDIYAFGMVAFELAYSINIEKQLRSKFSCLKKEYVQLVRKLIIDPKWSPLSFINKMENIDFMDLLFKACWQREVKKVPFGDEIVTYLKKGLDDLQESESDITTVVDGKTRSIEIESGQVGKLSTSISISSWTDDNVSSESESMYVKSGLFQMD